MVFRTDVSGPWYVPNYVIQGPSVREDIKHLYTKYGNILTAYPIELARKVVLDDASDKHPYQINVFDFI